LIQSCLHLSYKQAGPKAYDEDYGMLAATQEELEEITSYFEWQAPDLTVEFIQKVYTENILGHRHDVWDVHTDKDRWWVVTNPSNLYSQQQFPNMDLAVTFHVGLCLRIPRSEKQKLFELPIEPFAQCYRYMSEASDALAQAQEVLDYQSIGMRCREALLAFADAAQTVMPWTSADQAMIGTNQRRRLLDGPSSPAPRSCSPPPPSLIWPGRQSRTHTPPSVSSLPNIAPQGAARGGHELH
jgi:hypothetical protein